MKLLEREWLEYRDNCYPPDKIKLSVTQDKETRQAFMSGCFLMITLIMDVTATQSEQDAETSLKSLLDEAYTECKERARELKTRN